MSTPIIELKHISYRYQQELVLRDVSLQVESGDFLGLVGPNGGGKSTLLKLILGLLPLQTGTLQLFGQKQQQFRDWHKIGYVAQRSFIKHAQPVTVTEVLEMTGASASEIMRALELVDLLNQKHKNIAELSGGQEQRVFIARALLNQPQLLILDEPTVGVDQKSQNSFYELLNHLNQAHQLSIILVSHEVDLISSSVKNLACINQSLLYHGHPDALRDEQLISKVYGSKQQLITHHH